MKLKGDYVLDAVDMCDDEDACAMNFNPKAMIINKGEK